MNEVVTIVWLALIGALVAGIPGAVVLSRLGRRSVTVHICVLLVVTVAAVLAGVILVAREMFLSVHDLNVLFIVVGVSGGVSLALGWWLGHRIARRALWADQVRERERRVEAGRRELVAWVSHDLRTPLAGLRAMAEALEDGVVSEPAAVRDYHSRIRAETDRMAHLVDDLFELSRINASELKLDLTAVPLGEVVSDALASAAPVAAARGVRVLSGASGWPTVTGSEAELARVVANLLTNAVHYTPYEGTVTISAGQDHGTAWLAVTDTCGGIPESDLPKVFDVAFRGERARSPRAPYANTGGGGLGLAIVRGLVEAQGGQVDVANIGAGCRFVVRLPAA